MAKNYEQLADLIIENVGGKQNIEQLHHCATRLRFYLKDMEVPKTEVLEKAPGVIRVLVANGQYQVVIGNDVTDVYDIICRKVDIKAGEKSQTAAQDAPDKKSGPLNVIMDYMSAIIYPVFGILTASGILKGLLVIATMVGLAKESFAYILLSAVADTLFLFLPVYLGYTTAQKSGMTPFLGLTIGAILCYPSINGVDFSVFGHTLNVTYTSTFLPVIAIVLLATPLEKWLRKVLPNVVKGFATPLFVLLVAIPLGYCVVGPVANALSGVIMNAINALYTLSPVVGGILVGAFWQVLVVFGLHGMLISVCMFNIFNGGGDMILAVTIFVCFAQSATVLAMALRSKDKTFRERAFPAVVSGFFGVTEPAIYGITLPRIKYFIISCIGGAASGLVCGIFGIKKYALGSGIFAIPTMIDVENPQLMPLLLAALVGMAVSFVLTFVLYKDSEPEA